MTYNEMAQVLRNRRTETATFPVYTMDDLNVLDFNDYGTAMLEDLIFANADWLAQDGNEEIAIKFLRASFRGWIECRDNPDECVGFVLEAGPTLGEGHQTWQMNEVNKLIWPSPDGIGITDADAFATTAQIALDYGVISTAAEGEGVDLSQRSGAGGARQPASRHARSRRDGRGLRSAGRRNHPERRITFKIAGVGAQRAVPRNPRLQQ